MNSFNDRNWQRKIEEIETELNSDDSKTETVRPQIEIENSPSLKGWLDTAKRWFDRLPLVGKVLVGISGVMLGVSALNTLLTIISSLISIAILGFILYLGYRYFISPSQK